MKRRRKAEDAPGVDLPIVPMLDMAFQLLFFFVSSYHPSALEGQMQLVLPAIGEAKAQKEPDPNVLSDPEMEPPSDLMLVIRAQPDGSMSNCSIEGLAGSSPAFKPGELESQLKGQIKQLRADREQELGPLVQKEKAGSVSHDEAKRLKFLRTYSVKVKPDGRLRYHFVAQAMDACARAGFTSVGFAPPPDY